MKSIIKIPPKPSEPVRIHYTPEKGFSSQGILPIHQNAPERFESSWCGSGTLGKVAFSKTEIRPGFDVWTSYCQFNQNAHFLVTDHPSTFSFCCCLSGSSYSFLSKTNQPIHMLSGKQGVFYIPTVEEKGSIDMDIPFLHVSISITPERLIPYLDDDPRLLPKNLRGILEKDTTDLLYQIQNLSPDIQIAAKSLIHCPFTGTARKLFFESRALEMIAIQLTQISNKPESPFGTKEKKSIRLHPGDRKRVETAREFLISNLETPPSLIELSKTAGMSHPKLNRCFRQMYGMTAFQYLRKERLNQAKNLLEEGLNVTEAAYSVGYENLSHFSQAFKKQFGSLPSGRSEKSSQNQPFY